jgi:hypothetical protein
MKNSCYLTIYMSTGRFCVYSLMSLPQHFTVKGMRERIERLKEWSKDRERERERERDYERTVNRSVVLCTPEIYNGISMTNYIDTQTKAQKKQWVYEVIQGSRENHRCLLDTDSFMMLPDTEALNTEEVINWLVIFKDPALKSIRSLRGEHIDVLKACRALCTRYIVENTRYGPDQVMAYFHYLPSVFQLHVHFCAPYGQYTTLDICKVHTLDNVISNIEIDPEYYAKVSLTTVVIGKGCLNEIYGLNDRT